MSSLSKWKTLWTFLNEILATWNDSTVYRLAAALAFYAMFSFAPAAFIAVSVASTFVNQAAFDQLRTRLEGTLGHETVEFVVSAVQNVPQPGSGGTWLTSLIGLGVLLYVASGFFAELQYAMNTIWGVPIPSYSGFLAFIKNRLLAFAMVMGLGLVMVAMAVFSFGMSILGRLFEVGGLLPSGYPLAQLALIMLSCALFYKVLPNIHIAWRDVWVGATVTALLVMIGMRLIGVYLSYSNVGSLFGAAGTLVVLLTAVYYVVQIFLLGAVFTKVYAVRFGSRAAKTADDSDTPETGFTGPP